MTGAGPSASENTALRAAQKEIRRLETKVRSLQIEVRELEKALWAAITYRRRRLDGRTAKGAVRH